ncbi:hypothetical protein ABFS83_14G192100 [Erythranthe nasuta]
MEEIREMAWAYHARATKEEREMFMEYFKSLDADGDKKISRGEFKLLVTSVLSDDKLFDELDVDGDGSLSLNEVLPLFYMHKVSIPKCGGGCSKLLLNSYFTCLLCQNDAYHLCCSCYRTRSYQHTHSRSSFIDNRSIQLLSIQYINKAAIGVPVVDHHKVGYADHTGEENAGPSTSQSQPKSKTDIGLKVAGLGIGTANLMYHIHTAGGLAAATGCSIM